MSSPPSALNNPHIKRSVWHPLMKKVKIPLVWHPFMSIRAYSGLCPFWRKHMGTLMVNDIHGHRDEARKFPSDAHDKEHLWGLPDPLRVHRTSGGSGRPTRGSTRPSEGLLDPNQPICIELPEKQPTRRQQCQNEAPQAYISSTQQPLTYLWWRPHMV